VTVERSPLDGWHAAFPGVRIAELPLLTQINLRVEAGGPAAVAVGKALGGELPTEPCTAVRVGDLDVLWLGPDEWLVLTGPGRQRELEDLLRAAIGDEHGAVVDVSAQRTALSLVGPAARELLARGCAIDLDPRVAPVGTCVQTLLARCGVTIVVREDVLLLVRASFAEYLAAWLLDAGADL
jgi:sarcosine oxidase subunit gamma